MVVRPASDHGVEQLDQGFLLRRAVRPDGFPDFIQERFRVLGRRLDEKLAAVFAYILSEKVEAFRDMRDFGLLLTERVAAVSKRPASISTGRLPCR